MIPSLREDTYEERLTKTGLVSLEMRRLRSDLIEVFKIMQGLEGLKAGLLYHGPKSEQRTSMQDIQSSDHDLILGSTFFSLTLICHIGVVPTQKERYNKN